MRITNSHLRRIISSKERHAQLTFARTIFSSDELTVVPDRDRCVQSVECDVDKEDLVAPGIVVLDEAPVVENNVE